QQRDPSCPERLTVHAIQDVEDPSLFFGMGTREEGGGDWEAAVVAWVEHPAAVTGISVLRREMVGGERDIMLTAGGDGCLRLFSLSRLRFNSDESLRGVASARPHAEGDRASGVSCARKAAVTVSEGGSVALTDLSRV
ncbi:unnamed protein product, partial [Discosporangium mesarthrocarpum]